MDIKISNLTTGYHGKRGVTRVGVALNAELKSGTLTCLLGPNGSGKSTLLRTLCGFQPPIEGKIEVAGRQIEAYSNEELARIVGVVLTDNTHITDMSVWDVVAMGRSPYTNFWGKLTEQDREEVSRCMKLVGIDAFADRKIQTLSDGERQKVMIAKAIAQDTSIILLDEPTAFLDYPNKVGMLLLLHRIAKTLNKAVFLSTHDMEHALQVADEVWLLDKALGLTTGTPQALSEDGSIERYFTAEGMTYDRASMSFRIDSGFQ